MGDSFSHGSQVPSYATSTSPHHYHHPHHPHHPHPHQQQQYPAHPHHPHHTHGPSISHAHSHAQPDDDTPLMTATMYAPFHYSFHESPTGAHYLAPPHSMHPDADHTPTLGHSPPGSVPSLQVTHATPTRFRARRSAAGATGAAVPADREDRSHSNTLEVSVDPYGVDAPPPPPPLATSSTAVAPTAAVPKPDMGPRSKPPTDAEARLSRKREMGRERQRRKRLRDKEKRELAKVAQAQAIHHLGGNNPDHPGGALHLFPTTTRPTISRPSLVQTASSYDAIPSSTSSTYSTLPPMQMTLSPNSSLAVSAGSTSVCGDDNSPGQSFSPTMPGHGAPGFQPATSAAVAPPGPWDNHHHHHHQHPSVFGTIGLPPGAEDVTARSKPPPRPPSAQRRASEVEFTPFCLAPERPSPAKRRKSEDGTDRHRQPVGLGMIIDPELENVWAPPFTRPSQRRTTSAPDGGLSSDSSAQSPERSPTPPPVRALAIAAAAAAADMCRTDSQVKPASPDGLLFAHSLVLAVNETQWLNVLETKLGITKKDLDGMSPDLAAVYEKWRLQNGMSQVSIEGTGTSGDAAVVSPPPLSPTGAYATPNQPQRCDAAGAAGGAASATAPTGPPLKSPSSSSAASESAVTATRSNSTPSLVATMHLSQGQAPETPLSKPVGGAPTSSSSTSTSPVPPALQTPASGQGAFPSSEMGHPPWAAATNPSHLGRLYDSDWRGAPYGNMSSPIPAGKDGNLVLGGASTGTVGGGGGGGSQQVTPGNVAQPLPHAAAYGPEFQTPALQRTQQYQPQTPAPHRGYSGPSSVPMFYNPQFQNSIGQSASLSSPPIGMEQRLDSGVRPDSSPFPVGRGYS